MGKAKYELIELPYTKRQHNIIYKAAILSNVLSLKDLEEQSLANTEFKDIVCAAFIIHSLKKFIEHEEIKPKTKRKINSRTTKRTAKK